MNSISSVAGYVFFWGGGARFIGERVRVFFSKEEGKENDKQRLKNTHRAKTQIFLELKWTTEITLFLIFII